MRRLSIRKVGCPVCGRDVVGVHRLYLPFGCLSCSRPLILISHGSVDVRLVPLIGVARLALAIYALLASVALFVPGLSPRDCIRLFGFFGVGYGATDLASACLMTMTGIVDRPVFVARQAGPGVVIAMSFASGILALLLGVSGFLIAAPMR